MAQTLRMTGDGRRLLLDDPEDAAREVVSALIIELQDELKRVVRKQDRGAFVAEEIGRLLRALAVVQRLSEAVTWPAEQSAPLEGVVVQLEEFKRRRERP